MASGEVIGQIILCGFIISIGIIFLILITCALKRGYKLSKTHTYDNDTMQYMTKIRVVSLMCTVFLIFESLSFLLLNIENKSNEFNIIDINIKDFFVYITLCLCFVFGITGYYISIHRFLITHYNVIAVFQSKCKSFCVKNIKIWLTIIYAFLILTLIGGIIIHIYLNDPRIYHLLLCIFDIELILSTLPILSSLKKVINISKASVISVRTAVSTKTARKMYYNMAKKALIMRIETYILFVLLLIDIGLNIYEIYSLSVHYNTSISFIKNPITNGIPKLKIYHLLMLYLIQLFILVFLVEYSWIKNKYFLKHIKTNETNNNHISFDKKLRRKNIKKKKPPKNIYPIIPAKKLSLNKNIITQTHTNKIKNINHHHQLTSNNNNDNRYLSVNTTSTNSPQSPLTPTSPSLPILKINTHSDRTILTNTVSDDNINITGETTNVLEMIKLHSKRIMLKNRSRSLGDINKNDLKKLNRKRHGFNTPIPQKNTIEYSPNIFKRISKSLIEKALDMDSIETYDPNDINTKFEFKRRKNSNNNNNSNIIQKGKSKSHNDTEYKRSNTVSVTKHKHIISNNNNNDNDSILCHHGSITDDLDHSHKLYSITEINDKRKNSLKHYRHVSLPPLLQNSGGINALIGNNIIDTPSTMHTPSTVQSAKIIYNNGNIITSSDIDDDLSDKILKGVSDSENNSDNNEESRTKTFDDHHVNKELDIDLVNIVRTNSDNSHQKRRSSTFVARNYRKREYSNRNL